MRTVLLMLVFAIAAVPCVAQNVGIGTTTPRYPLSFSTAIGQKISFVDSGLANGNNMGIGIQSSLFQIHTSDASEDVAFGYGKSSAFVEKFRFKGNGNMGIGVSNPQAALETKGRIRFRHSNGLFLLPDGIWFDEPQQVFSAYVGKRNDTTLALLAGQMGDAGWAIMMNSRTGNVGIKEPNPKSPLSFPPQLSKKISLMDHNGFSVSGNRLEIATDHRFLTFLGGANGYFSPFKFTIDADYGTLYTNYYNDGYSNYEDVGIRYGYGANGLSLVSDGANSPAGWGKLPKRTISIMKTTSQLTIPANSPDYWIPPGFSKMKDGRAVNIRVDFAIEVESVYCLACGPSVVGVIFPNDHDYTIMAFQYIIPNGQKRTITGSRIYNNNYAVPAGVDLIKIQNIGPSIRIGSANQSTNPSYVMYEVL